MKKNCNLICGAIIIATAIIFNQYNVVSGFFLGFIYGVGISLLINALITKIRKK